MADDVKDEALNEQVEDTTPEQSPAEETNDQEQNQSEESTEEAQDESGGQEETQETTEEGKGKRDASSRIRQLVGEKKQLEQKLQQTQGQGNQQYQQANSQQQADFASYVQGKYGNDVDAKSINQAAQEYFGAMSQNIQQNVVQGLEQRQAYQNLKDDAGKLSKIDDMLNPDSDGYDSELEDDIVARYEAEAKVVKDYDGNVIWADPNVRLSDIAQREVKKLNKIAERHASRYKGSTSKQADEAAVPPSGGSSGSSSEENLSSDELAKRYGLKMV